MRILHVFDIISLKHGGGTAVFLSQLLSKQKEIGNDVVLYTTDYGLKDDISGENELQFVDVKIVIYDYIRFAGFYFTPNIKETLEIADRFDVIHLHSFRSYQNIVVHKYAKKLGVPYILDTHGSLPRLGNFPKKILKWGYDVAYGYNLLRDASKCVAETNMGIREYELFGVKRDKIELITPPIDIDEFSVLPPWGEFRKKYGLENKKIVMFIGRINWIKGLKFLVKSFKEYTEKRNDTVLAIVGNDDGYKLQLEGLINSLGIKDKVLFTGGLYKQDKLSALEDADLVVQTSVYEQGAYAPLEGVLCNTPIIVSNNSGAGEDVKRMDAGYLVNYGDTKQFAEMIDYVLTHKEEAKEKTAKAKEYIIKNMSMSENVKKYQELYEQVRKK